MQSADQSQAYPAYKREQSREIALAHTRKNERLTPDPGVHGIVRCIRFHGTYLLGTLLQLLLSFSLHLLDCPAVFAQALAIALVTAFNFAFHYVFTYSGERKSR